ncbi:AsmA family protein [Aerophototrophica crusticola]|uniref:AsmA family protein n=1 Tax=Aerophototrophica crusticola TaxID=1709002 RepID=A0A858R4J5_9PROT|nr:AsmA family protein [Rhodospirillaceae bacterium B3]
MRKLLLSLGVVVGLLLAAAAVGPRFVDWGAYRGQVAALLERATGRQVAISGPLDLTLLPRPVLTARDVSLSAGEEGPPLATVREVDLRVRPWPLLRGLVQVERLTLDGPSLRVTRAADGTVTWPIDAAALGQTVQVERLTLDDGTVTLDDQAGGRTLLLEGVGAELGAGSQQGPYTLTGRFTLAGQPLSLDLTAGRGALEGSAPLRLILGLPEDEATVRFTGMGTALRPWRLEGDLSAEGKGLGALARLAQTLAGTPGADVATAPLPFGLTGTLVAGPRGISLDGMTLALGEGKGTGSLEWPLDGAERDGSLVLSFAGLDLDSLPATGLPDLPGLDGRALTLDLLADSVRWRGGALTDARLVGRFAEGVLGIEGAGAVLPGGTEVKATGSLARDQGRPTADLMVEARTDDLRQTLAWAGLESGAIPPERLRAATLTGRLTGTPDDFRLEGATATLDTATLTGSAAVKRGERLSLGLRVEADRLNLDAYRDPASPWPWDRWRREVDGEVDAKVGHLTLGGVQADGLVLSAAVQGGAVTLRDLTAEQAAGVKLKANGKLGGLEPLGPSFLTLSAQAPTLAPLFRALGLEPPVAPERLGPVTLDARLSGDAARLAVELEAGLLGGKLQAGGAVLDPEGEGRLEVKARATLPETAELVRLWRADYRPGTATLGPFDLYGELGGTAKALTATNLQGNVAGSGLTGRLALDRTGEMPALDASLAFTGLDVDMLLPALAAAGPAWDLGWARRLTASLALEPSNLTLAGAELRQATGTVLVKDGMLELRDLKARWRDGGLAATAGLSQDAPLPGAAPDLALAPLKATLALSVTDAAMPEAGPDDAGIGISLSGGRFDLGLDARGEGGSPAAIALALTGSGKAAVRGATLSGIDLANAAARLGDADGSRAALAGLGRSVREGATPLTTLEAPFTLAGGQVLAESLAATAQAGRLTGRASLGLPDRRLEARLQVTLSDPANTPPFTLALSGPLSAVERTVEGAEVAAWADKRAARQVLAPVAPLEVPPQPAVVPANDRPRPPPPPRQEPRPAPKPTPEQKPEDSVVKGILDRLRQQ